VVFDYRNTFEAAAAFLGLPGCDRGLTMLVLDPANIPGSAPFNTTCAPLTSFGKYEDHFQQGEEYLESRPVSVEFQVLISQDRGGSPLPWMSFDPGRKFGFAIFDNQRIGDLGFSAPDFICLNHPDFRYNYYSVLTEEERKLSGRTR
jgi:hypothetical protein